MGQPSSYLVLSSENAYTIIRILSSQGQGREMMFS